MVDQAAIKALSLSVFERTFAVTTALNILTLAVAGFAILMSLLTLAAMRLPQLAPVWALGLTRAQTGRAGAGARGGAGGADRRCWRCRWGWRWPGRCWRS